MVLQLLYIIAFTVLAFLAVSNLVRNLMTLGVDAQRGNFGTASAAKSAQSDITLHPEMLDERGKVSSEPLLVMRSLSMDDARERLDALYNASPSGTSEPEA